jgi:RNA ligase (TIGR02306 family)
MKLASIERILDKSAIPNADKLELIKVLGWQVVVKKGLYEIGDLCIFIPVDTTIDPTRECFKFLADKKNPEKRVKVETTKLRGVFSQGLILPIQSVSESDFKEGDDVSKLLDVQKYEKESCATQISGVSAQINEPFPTDIISKTDEDNLKTKPLALNEFIGEHVYITLKMDGSSMTIIYKKNELFKVCSRNMILDKNSVMYQYVDQEGIQTKLETHGKNIAIQGEFCGPKVNGNQMKLKKYAFYVFNVKDLDSGQYLDYDSMVLLTKELGLEIVPLLGKFVVDDAQTIDTFQEMANNVTYVTPMNTKVPGEGIVIRPIKPKWSETLGKFLSVKMINQNYKD